MTVKLHVIVGSNNCRKVLATARHLGVPHEVVNLDFRAGDMSTPEYMAINPNRMVPSMTDGDFKLWESDAIMQYLCSKKPGQTLWPDEPKARADVTRWQSWNLAHFGAACTILNFERFVKPRFMGGQTDEHLVKLGVERLNRFAPVLNGQLEGRRFVCGDGVTLADFSVAASLMYAPMAGIPTGEWKHVAAWLGRMDQVPAWAETAFSG
jgi:glutathione S-transferase